MIGRVVALGFFDGVHMGHGALLKKTVSAASEIGASPSVMTYSRHPSEVVGKVPVKLINTTEERKALISGLYGISDIVVKEFTKEYSVLSCEEFFDRIIISELNACHVVAGYDFRFGKGGSGDAEKLRALCDEKDIGCDIIDVVKFGGFAVSSSRIRGCIENGDMEEASRLLGHYHSIISEVSHGANLGARIGFPTANQEFAENVQLPKLGVYLSRVTLGDRMYCGVTNIGVRPTVTDEKKPRAETNILGFSGDLYGRKMTTELVKFLRGEMRFASVSELSAQIERDIRQARCEAGGHF